MDVILCTLIIVVCHALPTLTCPFSCVCRGSNMKCLAQTEFPTNIPAHITEVVMDELSVESIPTRAFESVKAVRTLSFTRCNFGSIKGCAFAGLQNLEQITFYKTVVGSVDKMAFSNIDIPLSIGVSASKFTTIQPFAFSNLRNLDAFSVTNSTIHVVKEFSFYNISNIRTMFQWTNNVILKIERDAFAHVNDVGTVKFLSNQIPVLPCGSIDRFVSKRNSVSFERNNLTCDCGLEWVREKIILLMAANITDNSCSAPERFAGASILKAASELTCDSSTQTTRCEPMTSVDDKLLVCPNEHPHLNTENGHSNGHSNSNATPRLLMNYVPTLFALVFIGHLMNKYIMIV